MIIQKCDICQEEVLNLHTIVFYRKPIDYCDKCRKKIEESAKEFKKEIDFEYTMMDNTLKKKEKKYISNLRKGEQKI